MLGFKTGNDGVTSDGAPLKAIVAHVPIRHGDPSDLQRGEYSFFIPAVPLDSPTSINGLFSPPRSPVIDHKAVAMATRRSCLVPRPVVIHG
jgi:hypothetical protein